MTDQGRSVLDLVELLIVSGGLSPESALRVSREIDRAFGFSTRGGGSTEKQRARWRFKAQRKRARLKGDIPGGQAETPLIEGSSKNTVIQKKKVSKSDSTPIAASPGDKPKRSKGDLLPDDWIPNEDHYTFGIALGMTRQQISGYGDRMRDWAIANAHRQVARKSGVRGWNAAFRNWLDGAHKRNGGGSNATDRNGIAKAGFAGIAARIRTGAAAPRPERPAPEDLQPVNGRRHSG